MIVLTSSALVGSAPLAKAVAAPPPTYWSGPYPLAVTGPYGGAPVLVREPGGGVTVLWTDGNVTAKRWTATEGWGRPLKVGDSTNPYWYLAAAADLGGNVTAVWVGTENGASALWSARLRAGGDWSTPVAIANASAGVIETPHLAVSPDGHAWAAWLEGDSIDWRGCDCVRAASFAPGVGWSQPEALTPGGHSTGSEPTVAALSNSAALVVWLEGEVNQSRIRTVIGDGAGHFENSTDAAVGPTGSMLKPVLHGRGAPGAILVWQGFAGFRWGLRARLVSSAMEWADPINVSSGNVEGSTAAAFSTDDAGTTLLSWTEQDGPTSVSRVRLVNASGVWDEGTNLTSGREASKLESSVAAGEGPAVAMWVEGDGTTWAYYWSLKEQGRPWWEPVRGWSCSYSCVDPPRDFFALAATAGGELAVWVDWSSGNRTLMQSMLAYHDTTPPPLVIDEPAGSEASTGATLVVSGRTEPGAIVVVAGVNASVAENGSFRVAVALLPGPQTLTVTARDPAGNVAVRTLSVISQAGPSWTLVGGLSTALVAAIAGLSVVLWRSSKRRADVEENDRE